MSSPEKAAQVGRVSSSPAMERTRCRSTPALRPPSTTEDRSTEWRYATRSGSCRPFGPTRAVTSSSSSVRNTSMPTPTAKARSPWRVRSARSARETWTCSGSSILRCPGFLPTGRRCTLATAGLLSTQPRVYHGAEDRHFNFNGIRGNLSSYAPYGLSAVDDRYSLANKVPRTPIGPSDRLLGDLLSENGYTVVEVPEVLWIFEQRLDDRFVDFRIRDKAPKVPREESSAVSLPPCGYV